MNSHQRRKSRREEERFAATPEGANLIRAIDDMNRFTADTKQWLAEFRHKEIVRALLNDGGASV